MAKRCSELPWEPVARTMQSKALPAEVSELNARQCDAIQVKAKRSNVNPCNVKHEPIHVFYMLPSNDASEDFPSHVKLSKRLGTENIYS